MYPLEPQITNILMKFKNIRKDFCLTNMANWLTWLTFTLNN